jgi:hypothetical protein
MTFIPFLVFGAVAILLVVLIRRTRTASAKRHASTYGGDTWMPVMWTDVNADSPCDSNSTTDCSGADASCDGGGGGGD